jgi:predicted dehydrogenase
MNQMPDGVGQSVPEAAPAGLDWDLWCGPAPLRPFNPILANNSYNHCSWMDYSGGWTPGMAPHIIDLPVWACNLGFPLKTSAAGGRYFLKDDGDAYDNHEVLWQYPNLTMTWMSSLTNSYGFDFQGDPKPQRRLGIYFHGANGTVAADYGTLKLGRSIRFDPATEKIVGDSEAARLAVPQYRAPWKFPKMPPDGFNRGIQQSREQFGFSPQVLACSSTGNDSKKQQILVTAS